MAEESAKKLYEFVAVDEIPRTRQKSSLYQNILKAFIAQEKKQVRLDWKGKADKSTVLSALRKTIAESNDLKGKVSVKATSHKNGDKRVVDAIFLVSDVVPPLQKKKTAKV